MRYIPIKVYRHNPESDPIPFWKLKCHEGGVGEEIFLNDYNTELNTATLSDALWDMVKQKVVFGDHVIVKEEHSSYKKGEKVLVEIGHHELIEDQIVDIEFTNYESYIKNVDTLSDIEKKNYFKNKVPKTPLIEIRYYRPTYMMKSGKILKYDYMLYKLKKG